MAKRGRPKGTGKPRKYYTVYLRKTDEIIAFGTAEACASQLGLKNKRIFQDIVSKTKRGFANRYEFIVDETPYDEEE